MIWSEQELANMAIGGKDIAVERVMKQLDNPENADIFSKKNFSFLWGVLGVAGVEGASDTAKEKIWQSLKENGAVDAYDKGILADFTKRLAQNCNDNRMRGWQKSDNYEAGKYFKTAILKELSETNEKLELETISYCFDEMKLISSLAEEGLSKRLKTYLESLRRQEADNAASGTAITKVFEKEMVLRKLSDVIVTSKRPLEEKEKDYLYYYLREAVDAGFDMQRIGVDDQVLSRLMAEFNKKEVAEVEAQPMLMRNADIMEFVAKAEDKMGFFEECAAKFINMDKRQIHAMEERCLALISKQSQPKGVVFASELINLGQVKSAVMILDELAKKGSATEMVCLLHRLLPQAKGVENVLLGILQINLRNQHSRTPWGDNTFFFEYISRLYLQAARVFAEFGFYKESAGLLQEIVLGKWFEKRNDLTRELLRLINWLISEDEDLEDDLEAPIKKLKLHVFREGDAVVVGTETDNPITLARHRLEQKIKGATTFDVGGVLDRMTRAEYSTYGMFKNIRQAFSSNSSNKEDKEVNEELPPIAFDKIEDALGTSVTDKQNEGESVVSKEEKVDVLPVIEEVKDEEPVLEEADVKNTEGEEEINQAPETEEITEVSEVADTIEDILTTEDNAELTEVISDSEIGDNKEVKEEIKEEVKEEEKADTKFSLFKKKIHLTNTLMENIHEIGDEFDKLKSATVSAFKKDKSHKQDDLAYEITPDEASFNQEMENKEVRVSDDALATTLPEEAPADAINQDAPVTLEPQTEDVAKTTDQHRPEPTRPLASEIQSWEDDDAANEEEGGDKTVNFKNKVNVSNILKLKSEDIEKHLGKIRKMTSSAVKKAEEQMARVKKRVEDTDITNSQSVYKIKQIAKKISFFKKKP